MNELRDYQRELLKRVRGALDAPKARVMMQLPTGAGKTIIAAHLLAERLSGGRKAVWLTHRKELADQTRRLLTDDGLPAIAMYQWDSGTGAPAMSGGIVILMAQKVGLQIKKTTVWGRYGRDDILVIDEAHHAVAKSWQRAIEEWPGRVLGMTATPWRLSKTEGFNELFDKLHCGPRTALLQSGQWLCNARVLLPDPRWRIRGGDKDFAGEYTTSGIEQANVHRRDVMTGRVLRFWQRHAGQRQTVVYAVSVDHAKNLASVFSAAGIPSGLMLGGTASREREATMAGFRDGTLRVLVNVAVATEGFDLPDASCVVIARPTMSLALYLQMVGRGLRPKDGGDCLVLDLAGNALVHGLPEDDREWSLQPRGEQAGGDTPFVWCPDCEAESPAASHRCSSCNAPFGEDCRRCGKWRAWKDWRLKDRCGDAHERVCDLCHVDAHCLAKLPVSDVIASLKRGSDLMKPDEPGTRSDDDNDDSDLAKGLDEILKRLLEDERRRVVGEANLRREQLQHKINERENALADEETLKKAFSGYLQEIPAGDAPKGGYQLAKARVEWQDGMVTELEKWKAELGGMEPEGFEDGPDRRKLILDGARDRLLNSFQQVAAAWRVVTHRIVIKGKKLSCYGAGDVVATVLNELADGDSEFLGRCAQRIEFRSSNGKYLARTAEELYLTSPHLRHHYKDLPGGWLVATALDDRRMQRLVKAATEVARLKFRKDVTGPF